LIHNEKKKKKNKKENPHIPNILYVFIFFHNTMETTNFNSLDYPIGLETQNNHVNQGGYKTWKGSGLNKYPLGIASTHIRPLTNNDMGNVFPSAFGKARPLKHYRKGRMVQAFSGNSVLDYNINRQVKSSMGTPLGQGKGGGILSDMLDKPGTYLVKENTVNPSSCPPCQGIGIVDNYAPNLGYLTETPESITQSKMFCCNQQKKALRRVSYATTNLNKNYYTTHFQYLQNRCQTFQQKEFHFSNPNPNPNTNANSNPNSNPNTYNMYQGNCHLNAEIYDATNEALIQSLFSFLLESQAITQEQYEDFFFLSYQKRETLVDVLSYLQTLDSPNAITLFQRFINNPYFGVPASGPQHSTGCNITIYKPNNPKFATQGAVDSSTRTLQQNITTLEKNSASFQKQKQQLLINKDTITDLLPNYVPFLYKFKVENCQPFLNPFTNNKKICKM
jgi:hypothetical protein